MGTTTPRSLRWQGRGSAPFPLTQPCPGLPVRARSAGAYLAHSHWRFELHTGTSLPPQDAAHQREMSAKAMGRCQARYILQLCSAASSVRRRCQASATCDLMGGTLRDQAGKGREIVFCLAAAINITTINNHSLKPRYSFTPPQLQNRTRRMVARGNVTWPELPA